MSHMIENRNGLDAMFCVGKQEDAWHHLGQRCDKAANYQEASKLAGLDWKAVKQANWARLPNGMLDKKTGKPFTQVSSYTLFRDIDGLELGTVGENYAICQPSEAFTFVDSLMEANGGNHYDSAGCLKGGRVIWVSVRVPKADITVMGQDTQQTYLIFSTSYDMSLANKAKLSVTRPVCWNTLSAALNENGAEFSVRHTKNAEVRLAEARNLISGTVMDAKKLEEKLNLLAQRKMTRETYTAIMDKLFPPSEKQEASTGRRDNILAKIAEIYDDNDGNAFPDFKGTAYNLLQAVTNYTDHFRTARLSGTKEGYSLVQARAENAVAGTGDRLKTQALEEILLTTDGNPINRIVSRPFGSGSVIDPNASLLDQIVAQ